MSTQVVVTLPDDLYAQAQHWAALTHREVPQLLTEALALVLTPLGAPPGNAPPVAALQLRNPQTQSSTAVQGILIGL